MRVCGSEQLYLPSPKLASWEGSEIIDNCRCKKPTVWSLHIRLGEVLGTLNLQLCSQDT